MSHFKVFWLNVFHHCWGAGAERGEKNGDYGIQALLKDLQLLMLGSVNKMAFGFLSGIIRQNWNDTEKISMAPAQG